MRNVAVNKTVEAPVEEIEEHPGHLEEIHSPSRDGLTSFKERRNEYLYP